MPNLSDKIKSFREKHFLLDLTGGFVPGIGEAQDAQDLYYGIKNKKYSEAALAVVGLLIPGITGAQLKAGRKVITSVADVSKDANKLLGEAGSLAKRRPFLEKAYTLGDDHAKKVISLYEDLASGRKSLSDLPGWDPRGSFPSTTVLVDAAAKEKYNKGIISAYRGTRSTKGGVFDPNFVTAYKGTFGTNDFLSALYYSGLDKSSYIKQLKQEIDQLSINKNAKQFALDKLDEIASIMKKYPRKTGNMHDLGALSDDLVSPKTIEQIKDLQTLYEDVSDLSSFFGGRTLNGVQEIYTSISPLRLEIDFKGEPFTKRMSLGSNQLDVNKTTMFDSNQFAKKVADHTYNIGGKSRPIRYGIISNVLDSGAEVANDIVMNPLIIDIPHLKYGGKVILGGGLVNNSKVYPNMKLRVVLK